MTARIVLEDPEKEDLKGHFANRNICPKLLDYLRKLVATHKGGTRKINIPSNHDNVGVVLLGSSSLEETHLQMHDELHVVYDGRVVVIKWEVMGKEGFSVPIKEFSSLEIEKVRVEGKQVTVNLVSLKNNFDIVVDFELYKDESTILNIEHPLNQKPAE